MANTLNRWGDRAKELEHNDALWSTQMDRLVDAYLHFRSQETRSDPPSAPLIPPDTPPDAYFTVDMYSWFGRERTFPILQAPDDIHDNECLLRVGLISNSPVSPDYAFSILTLETFRLLRLRSPRLSIQAFVKAMCDTQNSIAFHNLFDIFTHAFDIYLRILRVVDRLTALQLGRAGPDWRVTHSCPPCHYQLVNEPPLQHDLLLSLDGGSSLKRFAKAGLAASNLSFNSNYIIPRDDVNDFGKSASKPAPASTPATSAAAAPPKGKGKGKGKAKPKGKSKAAPVATQENDDVAAVEKDPDDDDAAMEVEDGANDEDDLNLVVKGPPVGMNEEAEDELVAKCAERWKANASDEKKGMYDCFEESGVMICLCRHGIMYWITDMICSGEL